MGRFLTTLPRATSTRSRLSPPRMGTPTNFPSGVAAHWLGSPLSLIDLMTLSVAVSSTSRVWSLSTVVKRRRPSANAAAPCGWAAVLIRPVTLKEFRSMTWRSSPWLLVTYSLTVPPSFLAVSGRRRRQGAQGQRQRNEEQLHGF